MKSLLIIALTLITFATANAQTPAAKETTKATITNVSNATDVQAPVAAPATEEQTPTNDATAGSAPNVSANYVGTNDLNLLLLRQGVKKA
ncbi:MAG: hypothetical protein JWO03_3119 [Bacteroidetes bacterium]|nr:hypothetical protein [Bacteroidota bacterium]